ncbi:MAG: type II toxin-antitoxin system RelE/ParE family toxin [Thermomicrobiales bacterium]
MGDAKKRGIAWLRQAAKEFREFPDEVQDAIDFQLHRILAGNMPDDFDKLNAIKGMTVYEIRERFKTNTYRCAYIAFFEQDVFVLTCFMKKARQGVKTDKKDIDRIQRRVAALIAGEARLKEAAEGAEKDG